MLIDWDRINSLIDSDSEEDKEWLQEMIETLKTNMDERSNNILKFTSDNNYTDLKSELHQMKGVAANFGLVKLNELIIQSENFISTNQYKDSYNLTQSIVDVWNQTKKELNSN